MFQLQSPRFVVAALFLFSTQLVSISAAARDRPTVSGFNEHGIKVFEFQQHNRQLQTYSFGACFNVSDIITLSSCSNPQRHVQESPLKSELKWMFVGVSFRQGLAQGRNINTKRFAIQREIKKWVDAMESLDANLTRLATDLQDRTLSKEDRTILENRLLAGRSDYKGIAEEKISLEKKVETLNNEWESVREAYSKNYDLITKALNKFDAGYSFNVNQGTSLYQAIEQGLVGWAEWTRPHQTYIPLYTALGAGDSTRAESEEVLHVGCESWDSVRLPNVIVQSAAEAYRMCFKPTRVFEKFTMSELPKRP